MPSIHDIHAFYEANLPGYQRRHVNECNRFFLELMGKPCRKPQSEVLICWNEFREFVVFDWQGENEIRTKKLTKEEPKLKEKKEIFGKCDKKHCGGHFKKKQNRSDKSFFLGCSKWPKCNNTKPYLY